MLRSLSALVLLCASASAQNVLTFDVPQASNNFNWSGTSSLGAIVGNPSTAFQLNGTQVVDCAFQAGATPVASAAFVGGSWAVVPGIHGRVNNPLGSFFPPLATIDVTNLVLSATAPSFTIASGGAFTAQVTLTALSGTMVVTPLTGSASTTDLTGTTGAPTATNGTLVLASGALALSAPISATFPFSDPTTGASGSVSVTGTLNARYQLVASFCAGDGTGTACPCGNSGGAGRGCANSVTASGALLASSGLPVISSDAFVITASGLPATATGLYFQGTTQTASGAGAAFGDGLRCASGSVARLGTKTAASGSSSYPVAGDPAISVRGAIPSAGATRVYQCWYRNSATFCTASTFNLTNGLRATWLP